jgi:GH15 family glucan-1,4-alpha-glucosidase
MPRDIPVGNGRLLVCFDGNYSIRDLYFPHVGHENHLNGNRGRFGIWVDGRFSWVEDDWERELRYADETLVTRVSLLNDGMGIRIQCADAVDFHENVYLREIEVENISPKRREVRLFFSQAFSILGNSVGDTAAFDPTTGGIVHYKENRYFLANAGTPYSPRPAQYAVGVTGINHKEGTYKDAEDGTLSGNTIAQGSVDSVIAVHLDLEGGAIGKAFYWIAAGEDWPEVRRLDGLVRHKTVPGLIQRTASYWRLWANKETPPLEVLPPGVGDLYRRSLLVLTTQIDWQGGILAANDSDVIQYNRDTYSYVWPRDGALAANALDEAGYPFPSANFYRFIAGRITQDGYFLHKYNPDGTLASSWHPWYHNGEAQLPIQEDETALVIWALWHHFVRYRDLEFVKPFYRPLIKRAAEFMTRYRDSETGLPGASYDLWEEQRGIFSFTVGAVFGGLTAASLFCTVFGEEERAARYKQAASEIRDAASLHLWRPELNRFCRGLCRDEQGKLKVDTTLDASLWGLFAFGLYTPRDPRIQSTMAALKETLWVKTPVGGMARYENDSYYRDTDWVPGNPWFICTLWLADYLTEIADEEKDLQEPLKILEWVSGHALPSGVLAEQVHPVTGRPLSVSPLTWSHATFVASTRRVLKRLGEMKVCPTCAQPLLGQVQTDHWMEKLFRQTCGSIHGMCGAK